MNPSTPPPPFALEPGEQVVLSGGRHWTAWLFAAAFVPMLCMLMPVSLLPLAVSGRFWLTQRRLMWKPLLGGAKVTALDEITDIDIVGRRATLSVKGPRGFTMRFVQGFERLWGALVLFRQVPLPEQITAPSTRYRGAKVLCIEGRVHQEGFGVVHADRFIFLPREKRHDLAADAARLAGQLALAFVGVNRHRYQAELPFDVWLSMWSHLPPQDFTELIEETAVNRGGHIAQSDELEPIAGRFWFRSGALEFRPRAQLLG